MNGRIAIISEHACPLARPGSVDCGGQNVYVFQLARQLRELGYEVDVFSRQDSVDDPAMQFGPGGMRVWRVPAGPPTFVPKEELLPFMGEFGDHMIRHCRRFGGYDLVHANFWMSGLVGCRLKQVLGFPLVTTFHALGLVRQQHQGSADRFPQDRIQIEKQIMQESDLLIAECPQDERDQVSLYGADARKIRVIGCGFDPDEFWPVDPLYARHITRLPENGFLVLQLGRLVPRKGIDNVIRGFAGLLSSRPAAGHLVIVGGESDDPDPIATPEMGRLQVLASELGIAERVIFTGRRSRKYLRYYYSAADVFVTTPWYEPFGITPLESMACGTAVVGAAVGGIKFTVRDGQTGFLVPPRNPPALTERLVALYDNRALRKQMRANCLEHVSRHFTWKQIVASIAASYSEIISDRAAASIDVNGDPVEQAQIPVEAAG